MCSLYLIEDGGLAASAAVNVHGHVAVEERDDTSIRVPSEDIGVEELFPSLDDLLADGVITPEIDAMVAAAAVQGVRASNICGAGGGGCMVTVAEPEDVPSVKRALVEAGASLLPDACGPSGPLRIVPDGLGMEMVDRMGALIGLPQLQAGS